MPLPKKTNFEKIKNMSIDELEFLLCEKTYCDLCKDLYGRDLDVPDNYMCHNSEDSVVRMWLESEVEECRN